MFLGLLFVPKSSFACVSLKDCCKKEISIAKAKEKDCCNKNMDNKDCKGKCGHSNCTSTSSVSFSVFFYNEIEFSNNNFELSTSKTKFYHAENILSDGFSSIWIIPKIGKI